MGRVYPRSSLRKVLKTWKPESTISKRADVLVYLDYLVFLSKLAAETKRIAESETGVDGTRGKPLGGVKGVTVSRKQVKKASQAVRAQFKA